MPAKAKRKSSSGQLKIGDQWNAINIIAHSQTHPLKSICELTENAIDAGAKQIQLLRRRKQGNVFLEVIDDGNGISLNDAGEPDLQRIATHLCDSLKRYLDPSMREGVHGQFGIGLLSFWSLGDELRMQAAGNQGTFELHLVRGDRRYTIRPVRGRLPSPGTRVVVGPLLESTKKVVTGDKVARYLSDELRDRIRNSGVKIHVVDRVSRKDLVVTPREFDGESLEVPRYLATRQGDIRVELYFRSDTSQPSAGIALCCDGTRVVKDITELLQFQHAPWGDSRIEGLIDFDALQLAPGTRSGIVPDNAFESLVESLRAIEPDILAAIEKRQQAETDKASEQILKKVHKAFVTALRDLPTSDYLFFDIPQTSPSLAGNQGKANRDTAGAAIHDDPAADEGADRVAEIAPLLPLEVGLLASVRISPRHPRRLPGEACELVASPKDQHGTVIHEGVDFAWRVAEGDATLGGSEDAACQVLSNAIGRTTVEVTATQADICVSDQVEIKFLDNVTSNDDKGGKGLPSYRLDPEHGQPWRSRYDATGNEIVINSAHRDFLTSKTTLTKHRRYIGKLYAKEVVLINFPHESPADVMERLIEITLRTEDAL